MDELLHEYLLHEQLGLHSFIHTCKKIKFSHEPSMAAMAYVDYCSCGAMKPSISLLIQLVPDAIKEKAKAVYEYERKQEQ